MDNFFTIEKISTGKFIVRDVFSEDIRKHCLVLRLDMKKVDALTSLQKTSFVDKGYKVYLSSRIERSFGVYVRVLYFEWSIEKKTSFKRFLADKYLEYFYAKKIDTLVLYLDKKSISINRKTLEQWKRLN